MGSITRDNLKTVFLDCKCPHAQNLSQPYSINSEEVKFVWQISYPLQMGQVRVNISCQKSHKLAVFEVSPFCSTSPECCVFRPGWEYKALMLVLVNCYVNKMVKATPHLFNSALGSKPTKKEEFEYQKHVNERNTGAEILQLLIVFHSGRVFLESCQEKTWIANF